MAAQAPTATEPLPFMTAPLGTALARGRGPVA